MHSNFITCLFITQNDPRSSHGQLETKVVTIQARIQQR